VIERRIEELSFSSMTPASWQITMQVPSPVSTGYTVSVNYPFDTSWTADNACRNTADAFAPAVQQLLREVVADPKFAALTSSSK
jgi:hypothetical protein